MEITLVEVYETLTKGYVKEGKYSKSFDFPWSIETEKIEHVYCNVNGFDTTLVIVSDSNVYRFTQTYTNDVEDDDQYTGDFALINDDDSVITIRSRKDWVWNSYVIEL